MNSWLVIFNPVSGGGKGHDDRVQIEQLLEANGIEFESIETNHAWHAVEIVANGVERGFRNFAAVGGDGTLHEVANGILMQQIAPVDQITLASISGGTGNDWGRSFGLPQTYQGDIEAIKAGQTTVQDVGRIEVWKGRNSHVRYFINEAGTGLDAAVNNRCYEQNAAGNTGKLTYMAGLLKSALTYKATQSRVVVDDKVLVNGLLLSLTVAIGRYNGGGMSQTPLSVTDDGLFDITLIDNVNPVTIAAKAPLLFNGKIYDFKKVHRHQGHKVRIESVDSEVEADGEPLGNCPVEMTIVEKALRVVVGNSREKKS